MKFQNRLFRHHQKKCTTVIGKLALNLLFRLKVLQAYLCDLKWLEYMYIPVLAVADHILS